MQAVEEDKESNNLEAARDSVKFSELQNPECKEPTIIKSVVQVEDQLFERCLQELDDTGVNQIIDIPVFKKMTRFRIKTCDNCFIHSMTTLSKSGHLHENENKCAFVDENSKSVQCILEIPSQKKRFELSFSVMYKNVSQNTDNLRSLLYNSCPVHVVGNKSKNVFNKCNNEMVSPISYNDVKDLLSQAEQLQNSYENLNVLSYGCDFAYEFADCKEFVQMKSLITSVIGEYPNDHSTINLLHPYGSHISSYLQRRKELTDLLQDKNYIHKKVNRRIYFNLLLLNDLSIIPIKSNFMELTYDELFLSIQSKMVRFLIGQIMTNNKHNEFEMDEECLEHVAKYSPPSFDDSEALKTYEQFTNLQIQQEQFVSSSSLQEVVTSILLKNTLEMHVFNPAFSFDHIYDHKSSSQPGKSKTQILLSGKNSKLAHIFTHFLTASLRNRVISPKLYDFMTSTFQSRACFKKQNFEKILNIFDEDLKPFITQVYTKNLTNLSQPEIHEIFNFLNDTKYRTGFNTTKKAALTLDLLIGN